MTNDEAEKLARDLKEQYLADMTVDDIYSLCDFILSGAYKREIENAAFERAAQVCGNVQANTYTEFTEDGHACETYATEYDSGIDEGVRQCAGKIRSLIQPPAQKENGE